MMQVYSLLSDQTVRIAYKGHIIATYSQKQYAHREPTFTLHHAWPTTSLRYF